MNVQHAQHKTSNNMCSPRVLMNIKILQISIFKSISISHNGNNLLKICFRPEFVRRPAYLFTQFQQQLGLEKTQR